MTESLQWASDKCSCPLKMKVTLWTNLFKLNIKTRGSGNLHHDVPKCLIPRVVAHILNSWHEDLPILSVHLGLQRCLNPCYKIQHSSVECGFHVIVLVNKFLWRRGEGFTQAHRDWREIRKKESLFIYLSLKLEPGFSKKKKKKFK